VQRFHGAVVDTLLQAEGVSDRDEPVAFVLGQIDALPVYTRLGVQVAAVMLASMTIATSGRSFARLPAGRRHEVVNRWDRLGLLPARLYMRLVRSLTLFAAFDRESV
jgi:hypothetical protein